MQTDRVFCTCGWLECLAREWLVGEIDSKSSKAELSDAEFLSSSELSSDGELSSDEQW
jgi:hypothetical protein